MSKSNAHIVLNVRDRTGGQYNAALFNAENQNILQGDIKNITVSEVNFPYDIPNIQAGFNVFEIFTDIINPPAGVALTVQVAPGFYTGLELATAITAAIVAAGAAGAPVILPANLPVCSYDATSNRFTFTLAAPTIPGLDWGFSSSYTFPNNLTVAQPNTLGKDILSIMGYLTSQAGGNPVLTQANPFVSGGSAPLTFTQYVDICSPQLCKFQYFRDGSTTNLARRSDVICRLYISNNVALPSEFVDGTRPFIINTQFFNARRMRWTADNSVGTIDVNLYDDVGQPLTTTWQPRPYQITFNAIENPKDEGMMGGLGRAY
jgi:hypothetical protein